MARGLKFQIKEVERFCYLCSENKGTDKLCGYHAKSRFSHDAICCFSFKFSASGISCHFREVEANREKELQRQHEREMADRQIKFTDNLRYIKLHPPLNINMLRKKMYDYI